MQALNPARLMNPYSETFQKINRAGTRIETVFNYAGCTPFLGLISGAVRSVLGKIQALAGVILFGVGALGSAVTSSSRIRARFDNIALFGKEHAIHGALNMLRGWGEAVSCAKLLGFGNLFFLIPNLSQDDAFSPHFKYGTYAR